jgi:Protein of unknown function (DUF2510)
MAIAALVINLIVFVVTLGLGVTLTWPAIIILGCMMADRGHREYQTWLLARLRTPDGTSLAGRPSGSTPTPALQRSATHTTATRDGSFGDAPRMRFVSRLGGWQPDPTGRFGLRWWSGDTWTPHVMNGEYRTMDPLWRQ